MQKIDLNSQSDDKSDAADTSVEEAQENHAENSQAKDEPQAKDELKNSEKNQDENSDEDPVKSDKKPEQAAESSDKAVEDKSADSSVDESTEISDNQTSKHTPLKELDLESSDANMKKRSKKIFIAISAAAVLAGTATGFGTFKLYRQNVKGSNEEIEQVAGPSVKAGDIFGLSDEKTFKDTAQGYLEAGGINGEGSHKLLRPGGSSRTVYLTSSVTDLDKLVGMEVKVWGETYKGQEAGWLMDVGKVEVIDPKAEPPAGEEL